MFVVFLPTSDSSSYSNSKKETGETSEMEYGTSYTSYKETLETELKEFLESVSGVGEVRVLIYMGDEEENITKIDGIVVAAKGARDESVRLLIVRLVMALYGVEANKVEVTALL
jgi:hypothetical protein